MYSNLTKTNYEIKDMSLRELRDRIIKENNLTALDILKGFHEKSKIYLKYKSCLSDKNIKDINTIKQKHKYYVAQECKNIQKLYDDRFNEIFDKYKKNHSDFTLQSAIDYKSMKHSKSSVGLSNAIFNFLRDVSYIKKSLEIDIAKLSKEKTDLYIQEHFGKDYKIIDKHFTVGDYEGLPSYLDLNGKIDIDFSKVYEIRDNSSRMFSEWFSVEYDSHINNTDKITFYDHEIIDIATRLSEPKAKEVFDNAINSIIYDENTLGEIEFLQNLESQPITININTKTDKYELIDGYKRLLFTADEKLLRYSAPIKIFTDLNDVEFLTLLYSSNMWKDKNKFHDRGFLFALKTRFNFEIPSAIYENYYTNELEIIQLYDFGGNLAKVDKSRLMNTLLLHKHLPNDIKLLYDFSSQELKNYKYDRNMSDEIMFTIIEYVGELRRLSNSDIQNELSKELIVSVFEDDFVKGLCSKKHLSTRTYVMNYFRDKGLYKHIMNVLNEKLNKEKAE